MNPVRRVARVAVVCAATALTVILVAAPAQAREDAPAIRLTSAKPVYAVGEPVSLTVAVANTGAAACQLAALSDGTLQVTALTRDGVAVRPTFTATYYGGGYDSALRSRLETVQPGDEVTFPVAALGESLHVTSPMPGGAALATLWPVVDLGRYQLSLVYSIPAVEDDAATACPGTSEAATVAFAVGAEPGGGLSGRWLPVVAGAALVVLLLAFLWWRVRRRGAGRGAGRGATVAAGGLLVLVVALSVGVQGRPAAAKWEFAPNQSDEFKQAVQDCFEVFTYPGNDPAGIMNEIINGKPVVSIHRQLPDHGPSTTPTPDAPGGKGSSGILWNETGEWEHVDDVQVEPCSELYHELFHAYEIMKGTDNNAMCGDTGIPTDEVEASFAENRFRKIRKLRQRETYNGKKLPKSLNECKKPPKPKPKPNSPRCAGYDDSTCASSNGDPHLTTFDQLYYDFQGVGEFIAARATGGDLELQVRQSQLRDYRTVSVNTAVAIRLGPDRVGFYLEEGAVVLRINGSVTALDKDERRRLPGAGTVTRRDSSGNFRGDAYTVTWPDGTSAWIDPTGHWALRLLVALAPTRSGQVSGLLGDFDGNTANDLIPRTGGAALPASPSFDQLYRTFGDSWRITQSESLFDYPADRNTDSYTDRSLPDRSFSMDDLPAQVRDQARRVCEWAEVRSPALLAGCVLDIGVTGLLAFAAGAVDTQAVTPSTAAAGPVDAIRPPSPGKPATLPFAGTAGQKVFVDVLSSPVPNSCDKLSLRGPDDARVATGCIINGKGHIDRTTLPSSGTYRVVVEGSPVAGLTRLRLVTIEDQDAEITTDGAPITANVPDPGGLATFSFSGRAGERIFVDVPSSTLRNSCSPLQLRGPDNATLATGCVIGGSGYVDTAELPVAGRYTFVVDPSDNDTGTALVRLYSATQQQGTITINGPPVTATIAQPGGTARFTFTGRAGQVVSVRAEAATLPNNECDVLAIASPSGAALKRGCLINAAGGIAATTLPADGEYAVTVDPTLGSGEVRLRLFEGG